MQLGKTGVGEKERGLATRKQKQLSKEGRERKKLPIKLRKTVQGAEKTSKLSQHWNLVISCYQGNKRFSMTRVGDKHSRNCPGEGKRALVAKWFRDGGAKKKELVRLRKESLCQRRSNSDIGSLDEGGGNFAKRKKAVSCRGELTEESQPKAKPLKAGGD